MTTHALDELDDLPDLDDLEQLDPHELDDQEHDDPLDDDPAPAPRLTNRPEQARRTSRHDRSATRDALCELVRHALGVKIGHDVDRLDVALDHLDTIAANLNHLRATITTEHATRPQQDTQP
jgi:hypothetical protein